jgi:hypothetical protein
MSDKTQFDRVEVSTANGIIGRVALSGKQHYSTDFMNNPHYNRKFIKKKQIIF